MYDVLILGAGPAGMTAAIYAARANLKVAMIEASAPGGLMTKTAEIENYPGFESITGVDLSMNMFNQTQKLEVEYKYGNIELVTDLKTHKVVKTDMEEIETKTVIIATGTKTRYLDVPGEQELAGRGISWCAICDGAFYKNKDVVVIGGGNSALEEALYLARICNKVYVIHRREEFRADAVVVEHVQKTENIELVLNSTTKSFNTIDTKLGSVTVKSTVGLEDREINVSGAFIYIGFDPSVQFIQEFKMTDESGYIIADQDMKTNTPGIFSAGDINQKMLRQVTTAVSDGSIAAQSAIKFLES